jgi:hypothetical protein
MMAPFSFLGCLFPLIGLAIVAGCILNVLYAIMPATKPTHPSCGRCGYAIAGLTSTHCPECGAEIAKVGVSTRALATRLRGGLPAALVGWTVLCIFFAFMLFVLIGVSRGAGRPVAAPPSWQTWTTTLSPGSMSFESVDVATTTAVSGATGPPQIILSLRLNDQSVWTMDLDGAAGTYVVRDPDDREVIAESPWVPGSVLAFFQRAGLAGATIPVEATELERIIDLLLLSPNNQISWMNLRQFASGPPRFSMPAAATTTAAPQPISLFAVLWPPLLMAAVALVWVVGVCLIPARRQRLLKRLDGESISLPGDV